MEEIELTEREKYWLADAARRATMSENQLGNRGTFKRRRTQQEDDGNDANEIADVAPNDGVVEEMAPVDGAATEPNGMEEQDEWYGLANDLAAFREHLDDRDMDEVDILTNQAAFPVIEDESDDDDEPEIQSFLKRLTNGDDNDEREGPRLERIDDLDDDEVVVDDEDDDGAVHGDNVGSGGLAESADKLVTPDDSDDDTDTVAGDQQPVLSSHQTTIILRKYFQDKQVAYLQQTASSGLDIITRGAKLISQRLLSMPPLDDGSPLFDTTAFSKGDFSRGLIPLLPDMPASGINKLLLYLSDTLPPCINWPIKPAVPGGRAAHSNLLSYSPQHSHKGFLELQVCPVGCYVFGEEGCNMGEEFCPCCLAANGKQCPRYTVTATTRTPSATIHYRPLIPLITTLLESEVFVQAISHKRRSALDADIIHDLMDGAEIKKQMSEMGEVYAAHCTKHPDGMDHTPINLVLGMFWDGGQIHTSTVSKFYPTFVSFHNLPPHMRGVVAVGTFLLALDTLNTEATRDYIFKRCFLPELEELYKGIVIRNRDGKQFFVQGRLLLHSLDGKALETLFHVQASTAKAPCPICGDIKGLTRKLLLNKVLFVRHRMRLKANHYFRSLGQSGRDCPKGYSTRSQLHPLDLFDENDPVIKAHLIAHPPSTSGSKKNDMGACLSLARYQPLVNGQIQWGTADLPRIKELLKTMPAASGQLNKEGTFANDQMRSVVPLLRFDHADFEEKPYKRVSHVEYMRRAKKSEETKNRTPCMGCSGAHFCITLPYFNFPSQVNVDPFHAMMGGVKYLIDNVAGKRTYNRPYATAVRHPVFLFVGKKTTMWTFNQATQDKCDVFVECIRIPVGAANHFQVKRPFKQFGFLKGIGKIQLIAYVLPVFLAMNDLNGPANPYAPGIKALFNTASQIFKGLLSPAFYRTDINLLQERVEEYTAAFEGLFPHTECTFLVHQLTDLSAHIANYGPVRCWWTLSGERALSKIKRFVPHGGQSFHKTTLERYMLFEENTTSEFYSSEENLKEDKDFVEVIYDAPNKKTFTITSKLFFSRVYRACTDVCMEGYHKATNRIFELEELLKCLILDIESHFGRTHHGLEAALRQSAVYRLYYYFCKHLQEGFQLRYRLLIGAPFVRWLLSKTCVDNDLKDKISVAVPAGKRPVKCLLDRGIIVGGFETTIEDLRKFKLELYRNATVQGNVRMNTRGWDCREKDNLAEGTEHDPLPTNPLNKLSNNWDCKKHFSSWCQVTPMVDTEGKGGPTMFRKIDAITDKFQCSEQHPNYDRNRHSTRLTFYAQLNIFMVVHLPSDTFLNRLAIASVTCRQANKENEYMIGCNDNTSLIPTTCFVPMSDIKPIRYGVVGYDRVGKPFHRTTSRVKLLDDKFYSSELPDAAQYLAMCELDGANESLHGLVRNETFKMSNTINPAILTLKFMTEFYK